jgi:hypothetical protein
MCLQNKKKTYTECGKVSLKTKSQSANHVLGYQREKENHKKIIRLKDDFSPEIRGKKTTEYFYFQNIKMK